MMNIGMTEIIVVLAILLLLFGGKKLPELASGLGKAIREFKKGLSQKEFERGVDSEEKKVENKENKA